MLERLQRGARRVVEPPLSDEHLPLESVVSRRTALSASALKCAFRHCCSSRPRFVSGRQYFDAPVNEGSPTD